MGTAPTVFLENIQFSYGGLHVVDGFNLRLSVGEVVVLVGPSGCGKSTLLRLIADLEHPISGKVTVAETTGKRPHLRYQFQDYDAYPWLTVRENISRGSGPQPAPDRRDISRTVQAVGLSGFESKYPAELSGGMRKRLALGRCIVRNPQLLLLDEPFASLDIDSRRQMYALVQRLWMEGGTSVILVTHDIDEAIILADRVIVCAPRPTKVKLEFRVDRPRPRDMSIIADTDLARTKSEIIGAI